MVGPAVVLPAAVLLVLWDRARTRLRETIEAAFG
jgi:hypothetical protein